MPTTRPTLPTALAVLLTLATLGGVIHAQEHVLDAGDEIQIQVYQEADLSMTVRLDRTGVINYPYLGRITAIGKTPIQLQEEIDRGLRGDVLIDPSVNVSITRYRNFYIGGEVRSPGGYPFEPGLTSRQALTLAGGLTEFGSASRIDIQREGTSDTLSADLDTRVRPGDTITVREGLF